MKVDFRRLTWENYPSTETPINADNLNRLEEGVAGLYSDVHDIEQELGGGVGEYVADWLNEHVDPAGSAVVVDDTLTIEGAAADAKKAGDEISSLKEESSKIDSYFVSGINLFNPNDPDLVENVELKNSGATAEKTGYFASGFIPVIPGGTLCCNYPTGTYGSASSMVTYDANKQRGGYTQCERFTDANGYNYIRKTFPADTTAKFVRMTGYMPEMSYYMYVYADEMPATYVPYTDDVSLSDSVKVPFSNVKNVSVSKDGVKFIQPKPVNLVDLSAVVPGILKNSSTNGGIDANDAWVTTDYIPVKPGATYALFIFPGVYYGANFVGVPVYDENHVQIARVKQEGGSVAKIADRVTITIPNQTNAKYIRTSYYKTYTDNPKRWWACQIFEESAWPTDMYIPYDNSDKLIGVGLEYAESAKYNPLFGKSAMWNGDSICAADNDSLGGWPGRIAVANGMMFKNYGISGGTVAENTTASHSVSATLVTMILEFPDADYVIIEGGTNDADILGDTGIGTFDADDFTDTYINALDRNTFSGALESIFYRLVTQMKGKHIGYLIPQKMGHTEVLVTRRRQYFDRAKAIAQKWGIPVLDLWNDLYFNWRLSAHWDQTMTTAENEEAGNLYVDGQHLTTKGYEIQSPIIAEWMQTF